MDLEKLRNYDETMKLLKNHTPSEFPNMPLKEQRMIITMFFSMVDSQRGGLDE